MTRGRWLVAGAVLLLGITAVTAAVRARGARVPPLFELLAPERTGIGFVNHLPETADFNILNYLYYYNGGGVSAGDVDGDGRPDLYFTSNAGSNRLYRNLGDYRFEDITERAGVAGTDGWTTGTTMADVDGDGDLDLYVSGVSYLTMRGRNVLYLNDGTGRFVDRTRELGLEHVGYSTQALFLDYDGDGDLDMYLLNHSVHTERGVSSRPQREPRHPRAGDRLFRNDGSRFTDVSEAAGIHSGVEGYGLGVTASDVDLNGCLDIYVANDFQENDFLYLNNCDGTFTESIAQRTGHTSRFSMGVDAADFDNDLRPDLITVDMLPEREEILKTSANAESFNLQMLKLRAGYHDQYARNVLQLNRGGGVFSDIGYLAGVHATDWSWAPLLADLDNDGLKDLFITNGIFRRPNDLDYINYVSNDAVQSKLAQGITNENLTLLQRMPQVPLANYAFRNRGDLTFSNEAEAWGLAQKGFSNGAVYVDLDGSGALDLVVNNINAPASIYRNRAREVNGRHFLAVRLRGSGANTQGVGARVTITHGGRRQVLEQMPTRGFQSSVDSRLHFGLGGHTRVDSLVVRWPDGTVQALTNLAADTVVTVAQQDAGPAEPTSERRPAARPWLTDVTARTGVDVRHQENPFVDFDREPLMPHLLSTEGPALAVGDVNADGLDDLYVGGAKWQPGTLLLQHRDGTFGRQAVPAIAADSLHEDVHAVFFDADGDGDPDLYVVSAGNEFWGDAEPLLDRLYLNDGRGAFHRAVDALPPMFANGSRAVPADYDGDGDIDLFVGGRVVARAYGRMPRSYLLRNDGTGRFTDVTPAIAPGLAEVGMVTSAVWLDSDGDGLLELVVVGEWMPVRVFRQEGGRFVERTAEAGFSGTHGWWNSVTAADLDGDGRQDLVLGNLGRNSYLRAAPDRPARLYVHDFFGNGAIEQVLTFHKNGVSYPLAGRDELVRLMPPLRNRYVSYADFGASRVEDIFSAAELRQAAVLESRTFASAVAMSTGPGTFALHPLPVEAQFAPVHATLVRDFDGDGLADLLVGGNFDGVAPVRGRYHASHSLLLRGLGGGRFGAVDLEESRLLIRGQIRALALLRTAGGGTLIVVGRNGDRVLFLQAETGAPQRISRRE